MFDNRVGGDGDRGEPGPWAVPPDDVPLERVEAELIGWAGQLAAATARWLAWLAAYDRREGWGQWGCRSAAHWLAWKCGMSVRTGRDHVRVARALEALPLVAAAFGRGELSFSKVRALSRLPQPIDEKEMIELARTATASQLDRLVAGCRRAAFGRDEQDDPDRGWLDRRFLSRSRSDGMVEITLVLTPDDAARVEAAVEQRYGELVDRLESGERRERIAELGGASALRADAAVELLTGLGVGAEADPAELAIEVDITALATAPGDPEPSGHGGTGGDWLSPEVIRRFGCDAMARVVLSGTAGHPVGVGRRHRIVPRWLRRRLARRDNHHCQFPGCASRRRLHAHHIIHWAHGGATELDNLILLCSFHHHLVHEGGWGLAGPGHEPTITTPGGDPVFVPGLRGHPAAVTALGIHDRSALQARGAGERLDLGYAVSTIIEHNRHWSIGLVDSHRPRGSEP